MSGTGSPPPGGGQPPAGDPSMEDILASIRRILNEDEPGQAPPAAPPAAPEPEALALTEDMLVEVPPPVVDPPQPPPVAQAAPPAPTPQPSAPQPASGTATPDPEALLAPAAAAAASASVGDLLRAVAQERGSSVYRGGPTIEDVVREEVRPLLKEWLDSHLPPLVERLVRAEIERVVARALSDR
jgi:cell pole-organizing protein PopZ